MTQTPAAGAPSVARAPRTLSLGARRAAVIGMYGGYLVAGVLWHNAWTHHSAPLAVATAAMGAIAVFCALALFWRTGYWTWGNASDRSLDERQLAERNRSYVWSYMIVVLIVFFAMTYYYIAYDAHLWLPDRQIDFDPLFYGVLWFGSTLPSAMLAWFHRPPKEEE